MRVLVLGALLLTSLPLASATGDPPRNIQGTYDPHANTLALTWTAPAEKPSPDSYNVYRDGALYATTTMATYTDTYTNDPGADLTHYYAVTAVWSNVEGASSSTLYMARTPGLPGCSVAEVDLVPNPPPPGVDYSIHRECLGL